MPGRKFEVIEHDVDFCVVGGGVAGVVAALAAARHGARTVLMQDRPVLGGNSSSECRVHVCGADRGGGLANMRETGILEELRLENCRRNPNAIYSIWDLILHEKTHFQENLTVLLNCSCLDAEAEGDATAGVITSATGWQLTTQRYHRVKAKVFADCSGDAVLAPLSGAEFRVGREARSEYGESIAPDEADSRTMGMTLYFMAHDTGSPQAFEPPEWAPRFDSCDELPYGAGGHRFWLQGYWWVELGGEDDSIADAERLRDELLGIALGVWDHIKNRCPKERERAASWALDWLQFLPAKRESRRYVGDHVLSQPDVEAEGRFEDTVAYGGWSMDDHHPAGFRAVRIGAPATIFHPAPSPYGIPYRSLYSRNVSNLMFAGRCASATHAAMSSARVQGTGASMGQAVGTAAAIASREGLTPREVGDRIGELRRVLLRDDCYLPWSRQEMGELVTSAKLTASRGDPGPVRDGVSRPVGDDPHAWSARPAADGRPGDWIAYDFDGAREVKEVTLVLDSALGRSIQLSHTGSRTGLEGMPGETPRRFRLEGLAGDAADPRWEAVAEVRDNHQRLVRVPVKRRLRGVRFTLEETWGADESRIYAFGVE